MSFQVPKKPKPANQTDTIAVESFIRAGDAEDVAHRRASRLRRLHVGARVVAYLADDAQAEALRIRCVRERRSVSDAVTEAIAEWLART